MCLFILFHFFVYVLSAYVLLWSLWSDTTGSQFHIANSTEQGRCRVRFKRNSHSVEWVLTMVVVYSAGLCRLV